MKDERISREYLSNPFVNEDYKDRLIKSNAIDLRDNCIIEDLGNGYARISPIDEHKYFTN